MVLRDLSCTVRTRPPIPIVYRPHLSLDCSPRCSSQRMRAMAPVATFLVLSTSRHGLAQFDHGEHGLPCQEVHAGEHVV